ncbi:DUF6082 family protein [Streptomyces sp. SPB162]|jgi:hypothetical protein|uniref:DUF6082 family protein n=1 Tax=Streptomyces sp. SPB162 TaxID=2940560 RepID=UPI0024076F0F|nr:DUF6082 family protein [Streptomyces sp. SPB162]MDF9814045.1 hypothetical protein [Streptomyces sp. SPB162]
MNRSVLALAATVAVASAVHTAQRHLQHRQRLELEMHKAHGRMLEVATTHPDLDPIWVRNHPDHVKEDESGPLLMCQWWLEFWRTGLNLGVHTSAVLRQNAKNFMNDPVALKAWALTRHGRALQSRNRRDRMHVALLNAAFEEAGGPSQYPECELDPVSAL